MFKFLNNVRKSVDKFDSLTSKNRFMSNPFNEIINQTFVWIEKPSVFERKIKK